MAATDLACHFCCLAAGLWDLLLCDFFAKEGAKSPFESPVKIASGDGWRVPPKPLEWPAAEEAGILSLSRNSNLPCFGDTFSCCCQHRSLRKTTWLVSHIACSPSASVFRLTAWHLCCYFDWPQVAEVFAVNLPATFLKKSAFPKHFTALQEGSIKIKKNLLRTQKNQWICQWLVMTDWNLHL